jgi:signal transduction histidine kinase
MTTSMPGQGKSPWYASKSLAILAERGDQSRSRDTGGAGIGLAITTTIAKRHGGILKVSDGADLPGARFILDIGSEASNTPRT